MTGASLHGVAALACGLRRSPKPSAALEGSWDLVSGVINKVTILITTYNPN